MRSILYSSCTVHIHVHVFTLPTVVSVPARACCHGDLLHGYDREEPAGSLPGEWCLNVWLYLYVPVDLSPPPPTSSSSFLSRPTIRCLSPSASCSGVGRCSPTRTTLSISLWRGPLRGCRTKPSHLLTSGQCVPVASAFPWPVHSCDQCIPMYVHVYPVSSHSVSMYVHDVHVHDVHVHDVHVHQLCEKPLCVSGLQEFSSSRKPSVLHHQRHHHRPIRERGKISQPSYKAGRPISRCIH